MSQARVWKALYEATLVLKQKQYISLKYSVLKHEGKKGLGWFVKNMLENMDK
jgi:hypothetical protein